jgi:hypothetical protein
MAGGESDFSAAGNNSMSDSVCFGVDLAEMPESATVSAGRRHKEQARHRSQSLYQHP